MFMHLGMIVVTPGQGQPILSNPAAPYGATAITGAGITSPQPRSKRQPAALGVRVARITTWVSLGGLSGSEIPPLPRTPAAADGTR
jgi:NAD(P)H dehydrogenase (quinone)